MGQTYLFDNFNPDEYATQTRGHTESEIRAFAAVGSILVANFGGGVNSTAMVLEMLDRGLRPDRILFADTGSEHPYTMAYLATFTAYLQWTHGVTVDVCSNAGKHASLEAECLANKTLASLAFGFRGCSVKWKRQAMDRWLKALVEVQASWAAELPVIRCIGIHADEAHRGNIPDTKGFIYWRPLVEWGIGQRQCEAIILKHGLAIPRKSSCWFCPAKTKREVIAFSKESPDLFARAVAMEHNARDAGNLKVSVGLGRHWSWEGLVAADDAQRRILPEVDSQACIWCEDGQRISK